MASGFLDVHFRLSLLVHFTIAAVLCYSMKNVLGVTCVLWMSSLYLGLKSDVTWCAIDRSPCLWFAFLKTLLFWLWAWTMLYGSLLSLSYNYVYNILALMLYLTFLNFRWHCWCGLLDSVGSVDQFVVHPFLPELRVVCAASVCSSSSYSVWAKIFTTRFNNLAGDYLLDANYVAWVILLYLNFYFEVFHKMIP